MIAGHNAPTWNGIAEAKQQMTARRGGKSLEIQAATLLGAPHRGASEIETGELWCAGQILDEVLVSSSSGLPGSRNAARSNVALGIPGTVRS